MAQPTIDDDAFIDMFEHVGATALATQMGITVRSIFKRRRNIERRRGIVINAPFRQLQPSTPTAKVRRLVDIKDGVILIGSDAHYWPNEISTAHMAFVDMCKKLKPDHVVMNGDAFDGARISRFDATQWEEVPSVADELEASHQRLMEIRNASKKARHWWTLGNHDYRFEAKLQRAAPEMEGITGMHLKDHFPDWIPAQSIWFEDRVVVKHRYKGGINAAYNNTLYAGKTIVTGHSHAMQVRGYPDYNGVRYGVECGTLAEPYGPQFGYAEDNPRQWESGCIVITMQDGRELRPEVVSIPETGKYEFRGKRYEVG